MVSTPNAPNGLFDKIEREPEQTLYLQKAEDGLHLRPR